MNILDYARELIVLNDGSYLELMYPDDLRRIIKICRDRGLEITPEIAQRLWCNYSEDMCAGWLNLPDYDDDIYKILIQYAKMYVVGDTNVKD